MDIKNLMKKISGLKVKMVVIILFVQLLSIEIIYAQNNQEKSRRSQRVVPIEEVQVVSPDGNIKFILLPNAERLTFTVKIGGTTVIENSPIIMKVDDYDLSSGVVFQKLEHYEINETYPWYGAHRTATNHCNGVRISFQHDLSFIEYILDIRVFDDGIAFRHIIPGEDSVSRVPDEYTTFVIPSGSIVWYHDMDGHYEAEYKTKNISEVQAGEWGGPPLTFKLPDGKGYSSIAEANLVNYSGMALEADGRRGWIVGLGNREPLNYPFELRYGREEGKRLGKPASIGGTIITSWRVVMVARNLNTLVNSTILANLCPPPDLTLFPEGIKTSWIKPGRAVWRYIDDGPEGYDGLKQFSKWAGELGFKYQIVEGIWSRWSMEERKAFVDYSREQGVGVWFWKHRKELGTSEEREEFFKMLSDLGVTGAKIDFFDHEAKEVIDLYEAICLKAAEYHILLDFHGANKPTGRNRTWPNELVREAVKGMESRRLTKRASHETILPFTRYLAGPAEYTGMVFSERRGDASWAHEIACMIILSSPLLTIAASPQSILNNPAVDIIKDIPSVWDETIVLPCSEIGEMAAFARRSGNTWFLAVMCGPKAQTIKIPLSFLGDNNYLATTINDNKGNSGSVVMGKNNYKKNDSIKIEMIDGGGFVARFISK
jgi:alpha-glucosidase